MTDGRLLRGYVARDRGQGPVAVAIGATCAVVTLLEGIKTIRSGQGVIPFKSGVGPRGVPQGRNLFEPGM